MRSVPSTPAGRGRTDRREKGAPDARQPELEPTETLARPIHEIESKARQKDSEEEQTELGPWHPVCQPGADPGADEHGRGENDRGPHVDVSVPVVLDRRRETIGGSSTARLVPVAMCWENPAQ